MLGIFSHRYKVCKESAQAFYSKLAALSALQHFYAQQQQQQPNLSPIFLSQFQHHLMARAAAMAGGSPTSPTLTSPNQEIDMSLKSVGLGSPPMRPLKRSLTPQSSSPSKKSKISPLSPHFRSNLMYAYYHLLLYVYYISASILLVFCQHPSNMLPVLCHQ